MAQIANAVSKERARRKVNALAFAAEGLGIGALANDTDLLHKAEDSQWDIYTTSLGTGHPRLQTNITIAYDPCSVYGAWEKIENRLDFEVHRQEMGDTPDRYPSDPVGRSYVHT